MRKAIWVWAAGLALWWNCSAAALAGEEAKPKVITNSIGMKLVLIPAGEFMMGSRESPEQVAAAFKKYGKPPAEWFEDERPQHRVRITKPFYLGVHEVTVGQFRQFVEATGYKTDAEKGTRFKGGWGWNPDTKKIGSDSKYLWRNPGFDQENNHPVVNVSWNDASAFCDWLSRKEGQTYRLPTEAEWEYACRAGTTTRYWHGDDEEGLARVGNVGDGTLKERFAHWVAIAPRDGYAFTAPVGSFKANPFGVFDMHGNVWEWCADWYGEEYYARSPVDDPTGPDSADYRVLRGGAWPTRPYYARCANRTWSLPEVRNFYVGFRVARAR